MGMGIFSSLTTSEMWWERDLTPKELDELEKIQFEINRYYGKDGPGYMLLTKLFQMSREKA